MLSFDPLTPFSLESGINRKHREEMEEMVLTYRQNKTIHIYCFKIWGYYIYLHKTRLNFRF